MCFSIILFTSIFTGTTSTALTSAISFAVSSSPVTQATEYVDFPYLANGDDIAARSLTILQHKTRDTTNTPVLPAAVKEIFTTTQLNIEREREISALGMFCFPANTCNNKDLNIK
jgi:hypothetical protein